MYVIYVLKYFNDIRQYLTAQRKVREVMNQFWGQTRLCHHPPTTTIYHQPNYIRHQSKCIHHYPPSAKIYPPPPTTIHHHPPPAKAYPTPPTTTKHEPKYIHPYPPPPTESQNISTTTNRNPKYIQVRRCLTVCSHHVTYAFQGESTLYICLKIKYLLAQSRCKI